MWIFQKVFTIQAQKHKRRVSIASFAHNNPISIFGVENVNELINTVE